MQLGGRLPLFIELPRGPVFSESHVQNCEYGEKHTLPSAPISVLGKNFSKPPSKGLEAAEVGPVPWDAQGSTRTHNGIEHHPSWHPNLRSGSSLPTGLPVYLILGNARTVSSSTSTSRPIISFADSLTKSASTSVAALPCLNARSTRFPTIR